MTVFDSVKAMVPMTDAAKLYGYEPNRSGYIRCPFHNEKTASMKLYYRDFHCYGCGAHGTVIDFTAKLLDLDPLGAVKRLNEDFKLGIDLDRATDTEQLRKRRKLQETRQRFIAWRDQMVNQLDRAIRVANCVDFQNVTEAESLALRYREAMESWADDLMHGSIEIQMQIFRDREEVQRLCKMILNGTQTKSTAA